MVFFKKKTKPEINQYNNIIIQIHENIILLNGNNFKTNEQYIIKKPTTNGANQYLIPNHKYFKPKKSEKKI